MFNYLKFSHFFSNIQETAWYRDFLSSVINQISTDSTVLDIGTGSGKLLQLLCQEKNSRCTGTDTSKSMLHEAEIKTKDLNVELLHTSAGGDLPFPNNNFDFITICNLLFNLEKSSGEKILTDSMRVLKPGGKIIILTPTGERSFSKLVRHYPVLRNYSMFIWNNMTRKNAKDWSQQNYLSEFCVLRNLKYDEIRVFHGFAVMELITQS